MVTLLLAHLVDVFVEQPVVQQPVAVVEPDVMAEHADLGMELDMSRYNVDISKYNCRCIYRVSHN